MKTFDLLKKARNDKKLLEAELVLAHMLGKTREWVVANEEELSIDQVKEFHGLWSRILDGEPLAYIVKKKEFYGIEFYVDSRVLVPRPETELLVAKVIELVGKDDLKRIVDVGTGSGAIARALAENIPEAEVFATEFSDGAHEVAKKNLEGVTLRKGDLLEPFAGEDFDIIVANLPYIGTEMHDLVDENVDKYEPAEALYAGEDGLELYRRLFQQIKLPKYIVGEIGFSQAADFRDLAHEFFPEAIVEIKQDLSGLDRMFIITLP